MEHKENSQQPQERQTDNRQRFPHSGQTLYQDIAGNVESGAKASPAHPIPAIMKAAVLQKPFDVTIEEWPVPEPAPDQVLVQVMAVGVCGSDVHYYEHGRIGRYVVERPLILGHECSGVVVAVGADVSRLAIGDRVAVEPGETCMKCAACKEGRYNLCPDVRFLATPPIHGAFAQYIAAREDLVFPIPDELSFEAAAMAEPFSVGLHAMRRAAMQPGSSAAIMGMGPVGLLTVSAAKAFGAKNIIVSDIEPIRLEAALRMGASHAVDASRCDPAEEILRLTGGLGVDAAFETAGHASALQAALGSVKRGGSVTIVGLPAKSPTPVDIPWIVDNEVDVRGVFRYANTYPLAIELLSSGISGLEQLITDKYGLSETQEALEQARTNKQSSLKVVVYPNQL